MSYYHFCTCHCWPAYMILFVQKQPFIYVSRNFPKFSWRPTTLLKRDFRTGVSFPGHLFYRNSGEPRLKKYEGIKYEFDRTKWFCLSYGAAEFSVRGCKGRWAISMFWNTQRHEFRRHSEVIKISYNILKQLSIFEKKIFFFYVTLCMSHFCLYNTFVYVALCIDFTLLVYKKPPQKHNK